MDRAVCSNITVLWFCISIPEMSRYPNNVVLIVLRYTHVHCTCIYYTWYTYQVAIVWNSSTTMTLTFKFFMELLQSWSPTNVSGDAYIISIAPFFISSSVSNDDPEKIFSYLLRVYAKVSTYCTCMAAIGYCYTHTHTKYTECLNVLSFDNLFQCISCGVMVSMLT